MKALKRLEDLFQKGIEFIKNIKDEEKVVLVYDSDADGLASAVLVLSAIEKIGKKIKKAMPMSFGDIEKSKTKLKKFEKIITVDVPVDLIEKHLLTLKKDMLIIDHHLGRDLNSERIVLVNPRIENPEIYQPTSYVAYKMFKDLVEDKKWVAVVGTLGDLGIDDCKDLVKVKDKKNVWNSKFGKVAMFLTAGIAVFGPEKSLRILLSSKNSEELIKNREMVNVKKEFDREMKRCEREFKENLEEYDKILMSKIKPRYKTVCSALITRIATKNPEKMVFIFEDKGKVIRIHGRNSIGRVDIGGLFRELGIGGGHEEAGAGSINKKEERKLKFELLEKLKIFSG